MSNQQFSSAKEQEKEWKSEPAAAEHVASILDYMHNITYITYMYYCTRRVIFISVSIWSFIRRMCKLFVLDNEVQLISFTVEYS